MLAHDLSVDGRTVELAASIGVSLYPGDGETPQKLIDIADAAMYRAKADGGARHCFAETIS
jgi:diguanylate cyclase (GGDEF)-like protein